MCIHYSLWVVVLLERNMLAIPSVYIFLLSQKLILSLVRKQVNDPKQSKKESHRYPKCEQESAGDSPVSEFGTNPTLQCPANRLERANKPEREARESQDQAPLPGIAEQSA